MGSGVFGGDLPATRRQAGRSRPQARRAAAAAGAASASRRELCYARADLMPVASHEGWQLVDEGNTSSARGVVKLGYVSRALGSVLDIGPVPTTMCPPAPRRGSHRAAQTRQAAGRVPGSGRRNLATCMWHRKKRRGRQRRRTGGRGGTHVSDSSVRGAALRREHGGLPPHRADAAFVAEHAAAHGLVALSGPRSRGGSGGRRLETSILLTLGPCR